MGATALVALGALVAGPSAAAVTTVGAARAVSGSTGLVGVACATPATCWAVGEDSGRGVVVAIAGAAPGAARVVAGTSELDGVACAGPTACWAVGQDASSRGVVVAITGASIGGPQAVAGAELLTGVACGAAGACEAVGYDSAGDGVVVALANGVSGAARVVPGTFDLNGVACAGPVSCEAVGSNSANQGVSVAITHAIAGAAYVVAGSEVLNGVACPDAATCQAVGITAGQPQRGLVVSTRAGNPGPTRVVPATTTLRAVGCRSPLDCEAVGSTSSPASSLGLVVPITAGIPAGTLAIPARPNVTPRPPGDTALRGVACTRTTSLCEAVGDGRSHGDSSSRGVLVAITAPVALTCTTTITGSHAGNLVVRAGQTCLARARLTGSIDVRPGASLQVTDTTISGSITAQAPSSIRLCRAHVKQSVSVSNARGPVTIGDPRRGTCPGNYVGGALTLNHNAHGVRASGNHIGGTESGTGNPGAGRLS